MSTEKKKRPQGNTNLPTKVREYWDKMHKWGDTTKIQEKTGLSRPTIKQAMKDGIATEEVVTKITNYYLEQDGNKEENQEA